MPDVVPALKSLVCLSLRIIKPCFLSVFLSQEACGHMSASSQPPFSIFIQTSKCCARLSLCPLLIRSIL